MAFAPSNPNWEWLGSLSEEELKESVEDNPHINWLKLKWIERSSCTESTESYDSPPQDYVPVLTTNGIDGRLGFLTVDDKKYYNSNTTNEPCEFKLHAYRAAKVVFDLFRPIIPHIGIGDPDIGIHLTKDGGGKSISLPAMIAALQCLTGIRLPDTIVSTGCLTDEEKLEPVDSNTLSLKIETAKRFGYKKLIVVKGQEGIPPEYVENIIKVDSDPLTAILQLSDPNRTGVIKKDQRLARLLFYADRLGKLKDNKIIESFCENNSSVLLRSVAYDIRSRNTLHHGKTNESDEYRQKIEQLTWSNIPDGYLGHYLRYEHFAATSILEIDLGIWDNTHKTHQEVDNRLKNLQNTIESGYADRNDYFGALRLANTRAFRKRFLARYNQDVNLLESAWEDLIFLFDKWDEIFKYPHQYYVDQTSITVRQRYYCLECLTDYWYIKKCLPEWKNVKDFLKWYKKKRFNNNNNTTYNLDTTYNLIAELNYQVIKEQSLSENNFKQKFINKIESFNITQYPNWILCENILRFSDDQLKQHCLKIEITDEHKQKCLTKLKDALPTLSSDNTSKFILLALRTWQILIDNGVKEEQISLPPAPSEKTQLRKIYDGLISNPKTLVVRCPY
jgi:hypothetical protein